MHREPIAPLLANPALSRVGAGFKPASSGQPAHLAHPTATVPGEPSHSPSAAPVEPPPAPPAPSCVGAASPTRPSSGRDTLRALRAHRTAPGESGAVSRRDRSPTGLFRATSTPRPTQPPPFMVSRATFRRQPASNHTPQRAQPRAAVNRGADRRWWQYLRDNFEGLF